MTKIIGVGYYEGPPNPEIGYKEKCERCNDSQFWRYYDGLSVVYCAHCGNIIFDGIDADAWAYEEQQ